MVMHPSMELLGCFENVFFLPDSCGFEIVVDFLGKVRFV